MALDGRLGRPWHTALCLRALPPTQVHPRRHPCRSSSACSVAREAAQQEAQAEEEFGSAWFCQRLDNEECCAQTQAQSSSSKSTLNPHSMSVFSWNAGNLERWGQTPHSGQQKRVPESDGRCLTEIVSCPRNDIKEGACALLTYRHFRLPAW